MTPAKLSTDAWFYDGARRLLTLRVQFNAACLLQYNGQYPIHENLESPVSPVATQHGTLNLHRPDARRIALEGACAKDTEIGTVPNFELGLAVLRYRQCML